MSSDLSLLVAVERCPLCGRSRKQLTCKKCILIGNFFSSKVQTPDTTLSFAYKKKKLMVARSVKNATLNRIDGVIGKVVAKNKKQVQLVELTDKIKTLKIAIQSLRKQYVHDTETLKNERKANADKRHITQKFEDRVKHFRASRSLQEKKAKHQQSVLKLSQKQNELKEMRQTFVRDLLTDIFSLTQRPVEIEIESPLSNSPAENLAMSSDVTWEATQTTELELAEASHTVHIDGRWVSQSCEENEVMIVDIVTPRSTDFYKYCEWLGTYRNEPKSAESHSSIHSNSILSIPASSIYTSQLVDVAALLLGVNLPHHISHINFSLLQTSRQRIFNNFQKLIENVMYLCLSQCVPATTLQPKEIMSNLQLCFSEQNQHLGHCGAFILEEYSIPECPFDSDLSADELDFDSDSNTDDYILKEREDWDQLLDLHETDVYSPLMSPTPSQSMLSSSAGGLVTSAAASVASAFWSWKQQ